MSRDRLSPPQPPPCLISSRASRYNGGTAIAEDVWSVAEHRQRLADPQGYRPEVCRRCQHSTLHVHDYRARKPRGLLLVAVVYIVRFICANEDCRATWQVLPAFLARHLWWVWGKVEEESSEVLGAAAVEQGAALAGAATAAASAPAPAAAGAAPVEEVPASAIVPTTTDDLSPRPVPERTQRRWRVRLESGTRHLKVLMASRGTRAVQAVSEAVALEATRAQLVVAYGVTLGIRSGARCACVGALADRLERGIRLM